MRSSNFRFRSEFCNWLILLKRINFLSCFLQSVYIFLKKKVSMTGASNGLRLLNGVPQAHFNFYYIPLQFTYSDNKPLFDKLFFMAHNPNSWIPLFSPKEYNFLRICLLLDESNRIPFLAAKILRTCWPAASSKSFERQSPSKPPASKASDYLEHPQPQRASPEIDLETSFFSKR